MCHEIWRAEFCNKISRFWRKISLVVCFFLPFWLSQIHPDSSTRGQIKHLMWRSAVQPVNANWICAQLLEVAFQIFELSCRKSAEMLLWEVFGWISFGSFALPFPALHESLGQLPISVQADVGGGVGIAHGYSEKRKNQKREWWAYKSQEKGKKSFRYFKTFL